MDYKVFGLIITLILGMFILIGSVISFVSNSKEKYVDFSISLAFAVIIMLILIDLLPEVADAFGIKSIYLFIIFGVVGYLVLDILDDFIPDHEDAKMTKKEQKDNLVHIGVLSSIALIIHNIIEGMAIYSAGLVNTSTALATMIGVGAHNIPLGMVITSTLYQTNRSKKKTLIIILALSFSTFLGGLIMYALNVTALSEVLIGVLLSVTVGMLIYILVNELYPRVKTKKNRQIKTYGVALGIIIMLISALF
ncbi:MAG: ZIP family metal transporter [Bacilli bacterium]|nr:ZIP family metal transporter [Bacilli bacterium]